MKTTGLLFVTGERVVMLMNCKVCDSPLLGTRARILGICQECLERAGAEVGRILIVDPPTAKVQDN